MVANNPDEIQKHGKAALAKFSWGRRLEQMKSVDENKKIIRNG